MTRTKPIIAITVGDPNGIGPEIVLKSILHPAVRRICSPVLVGPSEVFRHYAKRLDIHIPHIVIKEPDESKTIRIAPGKVSAAAGRIASLAIEQAVALVKEGSAAALVTAPVSKKALHAGGTSFAGQTEMLRHLTRSRDVMMMLVSKVMRVALATIHIPVSSVSRQITRAFITSRLHLVEQALRVDWGIPHPRIAVLGLNPHAGEDGDIGLEDNRAITPAIRTCRRKGLRVDGPFPADAFFGRYRQGMYDAILAMYHDQGLIPLKMSSFGKGVNVTTGLPFVRTSPDHGTAFDIAGKGIADPGSIIEAIGLAVEISRNRRAFKQRRKA